MKRIVGLLNFLFVLSFCSFASSQEQTNLESGTYTIGTTTATINLHLSENQSVTVFKDTLLFEEDFNNFLRAGSIIAGTIIGGEHVLTTLPSSMTKMLGCKARYSKISTDTAYNLQYADSKFRTPILNIPNNSQLSFHVKNGGLKSQLTVRDTVFHLKKNADSIKCIYLSNISFVEFGKIEGEGNTLLIDDIKITTPREIISPTLNGDSLSLQGLTPNTKYYIEVINQDSSVANTFFFTTKKRITDFSASVQSSDLVSLSWINNESETTFSFSIDSISNPADDLLISKVACSTNVNVVEIYNPTERDICLKDYEFVGYHNATTLSDSPLRYTFFEKDSIKSNSCIVIALNTKISPIDTNLVVYPCKTDDRFSGGNDSYLIVKKINESSYDTIDLFGMLMANPNSYLSKTLVRKPEVRQGIKHNPDNVNNVYSEWNIYDYDATTLNQILGSHTINPAIEVHNLSNTTMNAGQDSMQLTNVYFDGVYRCQIKENNNVLASTTFRMGKEINVIHNGDWSDSIIWENGLKPTVLDKVVLPQGVKVNIPQNTNAECAELVISSNYSTCDTTNKAEIRNNGTLSVGKCIVKPFFSAYTSGGNGWTLFGLPINISNKTREEIASSFDTQADDDLFYLKEDYSSSASAWIPYDANIVDENFFKQELGYLIAYSQNKELTWNGNLFFENELSLLNNASYNSQGGEGYHLCANPYPFSVKYANFSKTNIDGMWLLTPSTGQYIPYNPNEPSSFMIPPFGGFMTKVNSTENLLKIHKEEQTQNAKTSSSFEKLHFTFSYEGGKDEVKIYFRENVSENIDEFDVYKLFSFGSAPDLYSTYNQKNLSIVSLPIWEDSVIIPLSYKAKSISNYELRMICIPENVLRAELYNSNNDLLIDFVEDSVFDFQTSVNDEEKDLVLKLYSFELGVEPIESDNDLRIVQNKNVIEVISSEKIDKILLYDVKGVKILESITNKIVMPKKACYLLSVIIEGKTYSFKIIYL